MVGRGVLADPRSSRELWLLPLRDLVALAVWVASYFGDEVEWRGLRFKIARRETRADLVVFSRDPAASYDSAS